MATLKGSYKALNTLSAATQAKINAGQSLVVVREVSTPNRVSGTMWYKGQVLGFTVEDAERTSKIDKQTCIPPSRYNLVLRSTGNDLLKNHEVQIPGLGKVFAAIGTDSAGVNLDGPGNLDFAGIRIHYGHSETFSAGCILFGPEKYPDGTILKDLQINIDLTWLIYNNKIKLIDVIDEFQGAANFSALNGAPGITTTNAGGGETGSLAGGASIASTPSFVSPFEALAPQQASQKSTEVVLDGETYDIFVSQLSVANPQDQLKDTIFDIGQQVYLPLRDIVKLLNKYILIKDFKSKTPIVEISLMEGEHMVEGSEKPKPLLCLGHPLQLSVNPAVCLIKNEAWLNPEASLGVKFPYDPVALKGIITNLKQSYWYGTNYKSQPLAVIQNIYVNLGYVFSLVTSKEMESQDRKEKNDIYVLDFLRTLMQNINTSIGNVANFDVFIDPQDGKARIIDINYVDTKSRETSWDEAYELQVHNLKSTVRNYSFESQIFNDQTTVVAIGAQTNGGALGQNVNSLVDFNQNLRDRIVPSRQAPPPTNPGNTEQQLKEQLKNLKESMVILGSYLFQLDVGDLGLGESFDIKNSSKYSNALKDIISFLTSILKSDTKNRAIIPTKLSLEMDGIGGIGIGNIFKIPLELLPRGYKGDGAGPAKIGYVVTGLSHNVDGNNWKTKIESQFIILDPPRGLDIDLASIQADVINITLTEEPIQINSLISSIRNLQNSVASAAAASTAGTSGGTFSLSDVPTGTGLDPIKYLIGKDESGNDYGAYNFGESGKSGERSATLGSPYNKNNPIPIITKTLGELKRLGATREVFAIGRYQFIPDTLKESISQLGLPDSTIFDAATQERLGDTLFLYSNLGTYLKGKNDGSQQDLEKAIQTTAKIWASTPCITLEDGTVVGNVVTGVDNRTYYGGVGVNRATAKYTIGEVANVIILSRIQYSKKPPTFFPSYYTGPKS